MTSGTTTLPLFPLSLVLFPGMTLPLHIFEERYKRMIGLCIREGQDFGVVLAGASLAEPGRCLTYSVGTTAHISGVTRFPDGCMNLITIGARRFQVLSLDWEMEYGLGRVAWIPEPPGDATEMCAQVVRRWQAFRRQIATMANESLTPVDIPTDPTAASYALAASLPVNTTEKQRLLEATDTAARLREILRLINREHGLLRYLSAPHGGTIALPGDDSVLYPN